MAIARTRAATAGPRVSPQRRVSTVATMPLILLPVVATGVGVLVVGPDIARGTGATRTELTWLVDAYFLGLAVALLPGGVLGERLGRRRVMQVGLFGYVIFSIAALLTDSPTHLTVARLLTGVAAGVAMRCSLSVIAGLYPPGARARIAGVWAAFVVVAGVAGIVGFGALLEFSGWRSAFWLALGLGVVGLVVGAMVPGTRAEHPVRLDLPGTILGAGAIAALMAGVIEAPGRGWTDPVVLALLALALVSAVLFVVVERRTSQPLVEVGRLATPSFVAFGIVVVASLVAAGFLRERDSGDPAVVDGVYQAAAAGVALLVVVATLIGMRAPRQPKPVPVPAVPVSKPVAAGRGIEGVVCTHAGAPLSGADVSVLDIGGRRLSLVHTDADGRYRVEPPREGSRYIVVCTADGFPAHGAIVTLNGGKERHDVTLTGGSILRGQVSTGERPAVGAAVTLIDDTAAVCGNVHTGAKGSYEFDGLAPGRYTVVATINGSPPVASTVEIPPDVTWTCNLTLPELHEVTGTVRSESGLPIADATVTLHADGVRDIRTMATDGSGYFQFGGLVAGDYTVTVGVRRSERTAVHVRSGPLVDTVISLVEPARPRSASVVVHSALSGWELGPSDARKD